MDIIADALNTLKTHEIAGQKQCIISGASSNLLEKVLKILKDEGYLGSYELKKDGKGDKYLVELIGKINEARAIKPRISVKKNEWPAVEQRFLPAYNIGILIVSTSSGVLTNTHAHKQGIGGKLIAYIY